MKLKCVSVGYLDNMPGSNVILVKLSSDKAGITLKFNAPEEANKYQVGLEYTFNQAD